MLLLNRESTMETPQREPCINEDTLLLDPSVKRSTLRSPKRRNVVGTTLVVMVMMLVVTLGVVVAVWDRHGHHEDYEHHHQGSRVENPPIQSLLQSSPTVSVVDNTMDAWESTSQDHIFLQPLQRLVHSWGNHADEQFSMWWETATEKDRLWWESALLHHAQRQSSSVNISSSTRSWIQQKIDQTLRTGTTEEPLVYLNSTPAYERIYHQHQQINPHFYWVHPDVQRNQAYCGVATTEAIVNSFRLQQNKIPTDDPIYAPYHYLTDHSLLSYACIQQTVFHRTATRTAEQQHNPILEPPYGLTLHQVAGLLRCIQGITVDEVVHVTNTTSLQPLIDALSQPHQRVLINFHRGLAGQPGGGGHFSPVVAYDRRSHSVLVADVAKYKYPYVWIPLEPQLRRSMAGLDVCGGKRRNWGPTGSTPSSAKNFTAILEELGCEAAPRGYIIVSAEAV